MRFASFGAFPRMCMVTHLRRCSDPAGVASAHNSFANTTRTLLSLGNNVTKIFVKELRFR